MKKLTLLLVTTLGMTNCAAASDGKHRFEEWAKQHLHSFSLESIEAGGDDIEGLSAMIGDARIIALSEPVHCAAEPLEFRNKLISHMAEHEDLTAVAIESGLTEGKVVHDYVRNGAGDLEKVLENGISWGFSGAYANKKLVRYLRTINESQGEKVDFYGFDVSGSPKNPVAKRPPSIALDIVLQYLEAAAPQEAKRFNGQVYKYLDYLRTDMFFDLKREESSPVHDYVELTLAERREVTVAIEDIVDFMERRQLQLIAATSEHDYDWAYQNAISARQVDSFLRKAPYGPKGYGASIDEIRLQESVWNRASQASRDRAQADNISWILDRGGPGTKLLVFAARSHLATEPISFFLENDRKLLESEETTAGQYLKRRYGSQLVTILFSSNEGRTSCSGSRATGQFVAPEGSTDDVLSKLSTEDYFLDLRRAPPSVIEWLRQQHVFAYSSSIPGASTVVEFRSSLLGAFDILVFMHDLTPATL